MPKCKNYFEPWHSRKSVSHGRQPYLNGIPEGLDPETASGIIEAWYRIDRNAAHVITGTRMSDPDLVVGLGSDVPIVLDGSGIIAEIRGNVTRYNSACVSHGEIATRIAACVTACAGISDPVKFIADARELVSALAGDGYDPSTDTRAISLLSRCIPPEELENGRSEAETETI